MKTILPSLMMIFLLLSVRAGCETTNEGLLFSFRARHKDFEWWISEDRLKRTPRWVPGTQEIQLTPGKVFKLATDWFRKNGYAGANILSLTIRLPDLKNRDFAGTCFYVVEASTGPLDGMACVILLDGSIVEPQEKKNKAPNIETDKNPKSGI